MYRSQLLLKIIVRFGRCSCLTALTVERDTIESAEFYCRDEKTGKKYIAYTDTLDFDWNRYKKDGEYIPGGSFAIGFDTIYVNKIVIRLPQENYERAISEIMILGK